MLVLRQPPHDQRFPALLCKHISGRLKLYIITITETFPCTKALSKCRNATNSSMDPWAIL